MQWNCDRNIIDRNILQRQGRLNLSVNNLPVMIALFSSALWVMKSVAVQNDLHLWHARQNLPLHES